MKKLFAYFFREKTSLLPAQKPLELYGLKKISSKERLVGDADTLCTRHNNLALEIVRRQRKGFFEKPIFLNPSPRYIIFHRLDLFGEVYELFVGSPRITLNAGELCDERLEKYVLDREAVLELNAPYKYFISTTNIDKTMEKQAQLRGLQSKNTIYFLSEIEKQYRIGLLVSPVQSKTGISL